MNPVLSLAGWLARRMPARARLSIYRFKPLAGLIRRGLNRAAPQGLTPVHVAAGPLAGCELVLDLQTEKDYWLGTYEAELLKTITDLVRPGMVAFDVGANLGYVTLCLARAVGLKGSVYAFEALPANVERLRQTVVLNGLESRVNVVHAAVVDREGDLPFLIGPSPGMGKAAGSAGRHEVSYAESVTVDGLTMDSFVYEQGHPLPQVVKMDIEGGEVLALPGMQRLLAGAQPLILLELHGPQAARVAWDRLTSAGYGIHHMRPGYPSVKDVDELDWKAYLVAWV